MKIEKLKINLIDIGSVGGIEEPWQKKYIKNLIQFEPNESALVKENYWKYPYAISDQNKMETFYVYGESGTGSSLKKQNIKWFEKNHNLVSDFGERRLNESWLERSKLIKSFDVECIKLDNFLNNHRKKNKFCTFEFMKSDTQGGEWEILQGAENFIKN